MKIKQMLGLGHDQLFSILQMIHGQYQWAIQMVLVLSVAYFLRVLFSKLCKKWLPFAQKSPSIWAEALIEASQLPFRLILMLLTAVLLVEIVHYEIIPIPLFKKFERLIQLMFIGIFTLFAWKFGVNFEKGYLEKKDLMKRIDLTTVKAILNGYQAVLFLMVILSVLQLFGIPLSGVIAFGGIGGIAVGFAAKDLLANFFGGMMIFLDRPFALGESIRSPDREIEGIVEHISWRQVQIRNLDQRLLYVPNALFSTMVIENQSRMVHRRIKQVFGIRYEDVGKLNAVVLSIEKFLKEQEQIDHHKPILVALINPSSYSLEILVEAFTKAVNKMQFYQVQHAIFIQILLIIESLGAQCPYPTQTLFLENIHKVSNHVENKLQ